MGTRVAILQSNYIPWKGYFDIINFADEFVFYDEVQYTKNDWRNRNLIKTRQGIQWLTIPVRRDFGQRIDEATVVGHEWAKKHWGSISQSYARAPFFRTFAERFAQAYDACAAEDHLSKINSHLIRTICDVIGIGTRLSWSTDYGAGGGKTERLVSICSALGASEYLSGPAGQDYLDTAAFSAAGIAVRFMDYSGYPEYPQLFGPFEHRLSIIDLIFNAGPDAPRYMKSFGLNGEPVA